ncbi:hypothetical protein D3C72_2466830 [compost metagenome]
MAAAGVALLLSDHLHRDQRRSVGLTLVAVGALTTLPLAVEVISSARASGTDAPDREVSKARPEAAEAHGGRSHITTGRYLP